MDMDSDDSLVALQLESGEPVGLVLKSAEAPPPPPEEPPVKKRKSKKEIGAATPAAASEAPAAGEIKKCTGFCGKKKVASEFHKDQTKCKECNTHERAFWRQAAQQECKQEMSELQKSDPQMHKDIVKAFVKERIKCGQEEKKIKFSISTFKKSLQSRSGDRCENQRQMMWHGHWLEEAKTAKHGYLTPEEAQSKWDTWLADETVYKDNNGPRGFRRVAVPDRTMLADFDEVAHQKELTQTERLSRTATAQTLQARARMVVSESADPEGEKVGGVSVANLRTQAHVTGVNMDAMSAPSLRHAADTAAKNRRRASKGGQDAAHDESNDENASQESGEKEQDEGKGKEKDKEKNKWFDAETKCRKAERSWISGIESLEKTLKDLLQECLNLLAEFRALGTAGVSDFTEELSILDRRQRWLHAVLEGDDHLQRMFEKQSEEEEKARDSESKTTSADLEALARAGPCKDYRDLKSIPALRQLGSDFRLCTSNQAIKDTAEQCGKHKKKVSTLVAAVKAAKGDLIAAKKRQVATQKKEEEKAAKAERAAAKAAATAAAGEKNKPGGEESQTQRSVSRKKVSTQAFLLDNNSDLWQDESFRIQILPNRQVGNLQEPFIVTNVTLPEETRGKVSQFGRVFSGSALRVTEGRAHTALPSNGVLTTAVADHLPKDWCLEAADETDFPKELLPTMRSSSFGFAALAVSSARTELAMLPCVRVIQEGSLMVAVQCPQTFAKGSMAAAQALMAQGSPEELLKAAKSGELRLATLGAGDLLYIPPASIVSHKAHGVDVLGVRMGVLSAMFNQRLSALKADEDLPPNMLKTIEAAVREQAKEGYNVNEDDFAVAAELEGDTDSEGSNQEKKQDELNSGAVPLESHSQLPDRVDTASGAEKAEVLVGDAAASAKASMPPNDSGKKISEHDFEEKSKSGANAARPEFKNDPLSEKLQTVAVVSTPITINGKQETESQTSQPPAAAANESLAVSAGSPAEARKESPQSPRAAAKLPSQEKTSPSKGQKGKEQKPKEDSQDAPVLPKKLADKEADKKMPQPKELPPDANTGAEPAPSTKERKRKGEVEATPPLKGKAKPKAKDEAKTKKAKK